ncbi:MAG: HNH endonuclease [Actinobacteria bacterium]|nr:HNH endonuclease [Actinomycetota bacterium]
MRPSGGRRKPPGSAPTWFRRRSTNGYATWFGWIPGENRYATIAEHRLTVERALGRPLLRSEEVHHRNGVRDDNRLENLELRQRPHGSGATHCPHCGKVLCEIPVAESRSRPTKEV